MASLNRLLDLFSFLLEILFPARAIKMLNLHCQPSLGKQTSCHNLCCFHSSHCVHLRERKANESCYETALRKVSEFS